MNENTFRKMYTPEEIKAIAGGGGAGLEVIEITGASTSGTLNEAQMAIVNSDKPSCVKFNNEYYYKNDDNHTEGVTVYTHTGYTKTDGGSTIKYFSITLATSAWTLTTTNLPGKLYLHQIRFSAYYYDGTTTDKYYFTVDFILPRSTKYSSIDLYLDQYYDNKVDGSDLYMGLTLASPFNKLPPATKLIIGAYLEKTSRHAANCTIVYKDLSAENWTTNNYSVRNLTIESQFTVLITPL